MPQKTLDEYLKQWRKQATENQPQPQNQQKQGEPRYKITGFYKETQFRETPIGKIPKEWKLVELGLVAGKVKGKKPEDTCEDDTQECLPYLEAQVLRGLEAPKYAKPRNEIIVEPGDTVMIWDGSYAGEVFLVKEKGILASTMVKLTPKTNELNPRYLYYWLLHKGEPLRKRRRGTGIPHVSEQVFSNLPIALPPLEEQYGIAEVLSSVDEAIEATDRLIQKLEYVKKALMQELLTKGIGHKEFQETPIGKIPKEWKLTKLSNIAKIVMGQSPPSSTYNEKGIGVPFLQGRAEFGRIYVEPRLYTSKPIKIAEKGDLLISVRAPVGDVNIAPYKLCIGRGLASIRFNPTNASTFYYFYYFQHIKPMLEALGKGTTFKAITKKELENLQLPLPPLDEQLQIANTLKSIDDWIELEMRRKEKLISLKLGLMDLLLTGRVRVKVAVR